MKFISMKLGTFLASKDRRLKWNELSRQNTRKNDQLRSLTEHSRFGATDAHNGCLRVFTPTALKLMG